MITVVRWILGLGGLLLGLSLALLALALGDCSSFGGRCPAEGLNDDVFGMAGTGIAMAVALPVVARGWSRRAVITGLVAGLVIGALGGWAAAVAARG